MIDKMLFFLGIQGGKIGLSLILFVSFYDLLMKGARGFFEFSISWNGLIVIWGGIGFIFVSKFLQKNKW
jgi:hypothetical protein